MSLAWWSCYNLDLTFQWAWNKKLIDMVLLMSPERHKLIQRFKWLWVYKRLHAKEWSTAFKNYLSSHGKLVEPFYRYCL